MATGPEQPRRERSSWNPAGHAIWSRRQVDPNDAAATTVLLRHPSAPFTTVVSDLGDNTLQRVAFDYLQRATDLTVISPALTLPDEWLAALGGAPRHAAAFGWLPIQWPPETSNDPELPDSYHSFRVERRADGQLLPDRTIILMASERLDGIVLGSEFGLRVVLHAFSRPGAGGSEFDIRITGLSATLPFGDYRRDGLASADWSTPTLAARFAGNLFAPAARRVSGLLGLIDVRTQGLRLARSGDDSWRIERRGTGRARMPIGDDDATKRVRFRNYAYAFVMSEIVSSDGRPSGQPASIRKQPLFADARPGQAGLFPIDPASQGRAEGHRQRRPTRSDKMLAAFLAETTLANQRNVTLQFGSPELVRTMVAPRFVRSEQGRNADQAKTVDLPGTGPDIRSNDFAAVSAFHNVEDFFDRLAAYGIDAGSYFRLAKLPLKVAYRSGVEPGPGKDGQVVNARVIADNWSPDVVAPPGSAQRPALQLHLALANTRHRHRKPWDKTRPSQAEPLGIAADARWIWHEIGHVILMASIGELEFRFAHSPGDALAAIAMDPHSKLNANPASRGLTFPWVFVPRRHDRSVLQGWSWSGTMHRALAHAATQTPNRRKAYASEQILSSSLFRLYRCLGGDTDRPGSTDPDTYVRAGASHYVMYLIFRGVQIMGTSGITVGSTPDDFVSALIDADVGTATWSVRYPAVGGDTYRRVGGCAHKATRWAFEAQGLYGPAGTIWNALGLPPPVDIYIADGRPSIDRTPAGDIDHGPGNYLPVSLAWNSNQNGHDAAPAWQSPAAIAVQDDGIWVSVGNRGNAMAEQVTVSVWFCAWPGNTEPPAWDQGAGWTLCDPPAGAAPSIGASQTASFGPFTYQPPATRYVVLARATCAADPANIDASTGLPCSHLATAIRDLVAGDNNLALRVLGQP